MDFDRAKLILLASCLLLVGACAGPAPHIVIEPEAVDLGKLDEGVEVKRNFAIKNTGNSQLKIYEAHSSCGCTVPTLKKSDLAPGETADLEIMIDTSMKQGKVDKTVEVSSNDPNRPVVPVAIKMDVANRHEGLTESGKVKIFTSEKCTSCHVDQGVGLAGKALFEADCAMCHGKEARGAVGGALVYGDYTNEEYVRHIKQVISYGSKTHRSMPGFLDEAGGPLIAKQIDSLVDYLKELSIKERAAAKKKTSEALKESTEAGKE